MTKARLGDQGHRWLLTVVFVALLVVGCSGDDDESAGNVDTTTTVASTVDSAPDQQVVDIYNHSCIACHDGDGSGIGPNPPFDTEASSRSFDERVAVVRDGDSEVVPPHPGFQGELTDDEIEALVRYADQLGSQPS